MRWDIVVFLQFGLNIFEWKLHCFHSALGLSLPCDVTTHLLFETFALVTVQHGEHSEHILIILIWRQIRNYFKASYEQASHLHVRLHPQGSVLMGPLMDLTLHQHANTLRAYLYAVGRQVVVDRWSHFTRSDFGKRARSADSLPAPGILIFVWVVELAGSIREQVDLPCSLLYISNLSLSKDFHTIYLNIFHSESWELVCWNIPIS